MITARPNLRSTNKIIITRLYSYCQIKLYKIMKTSIISQIKQSIDNAVEEVKCFDRSLMMIVAIVVLEAKRLGDAR